MLFQSLFKRQILRDANSIFIDSSTFSVIKNGSLSLNKISVLLFVFVSLTLLSAGVFVDKSSVFALPEGVGHPGFSGPPSLGNLPSPGKSSPPSLGNLPSPGKSSPPRVNAENGLPYHSNINPNNIHPKNAQPSAHCTGFGASINPCNNSNKIQDNSNHIEENCTGFGISANPCNKHVDPCLVNPCPISPCNINPCHTSDGTVVVGTESTANSYSSSPIIVNGEQSSSTTTNTVNENQETGSSSESIPVADAGSDKNVHSLNHVTLDGSKSYNPDGKKIDYSWVQLAGGPIVSLSDDNSVKPSFDAPQVTEPTTLTFQLIVNNNNVVSSPSYVTITVKP
ncbi:MAG TPA: hypothetical protein VH500_11570 [Nitrososphaeraceae archaeon]